MSKLKQGVGVNAGKHAQNAKLWNSYLKNPTERRHEALWNLYQPLVRHVAERFNDKVENRFDLSALIDAGNIGLLDALADFSPKFEPTFESLAVPMIRAAMARSLAVECSKDHAYVMRMELSDAIARIDDERAPSLQHAEALIKFGAILVRSEHAAR